jgi:hypothetical protein
MSSTINVADLTFKQELNMYRFSAWNVFEENIKDTVQLLSHILDPLENVYEEKSSLKVLPP